MKKKDLGLESRLISIASELFTKYGYSDVDMRTIARNAGCAVGTMYNYFDSKDTLYIEVFKESWRQTIEKFDAIICSPKLPADKAGEFLTELFRGKQARRYLSQEILYRGFHEENGEIALKLRTLWDEQICAKLKLILEENCDGRRGMSKEHLNTLAAAMVFSVMSLSDLTLGDDDCKERFIEAYVRKIMD